MKPVHSLILIWALAGFMAVQLAGCKKGAKDTPEELFAAAQQLQQEEKYEDAIRVYRRIAQEFADTRKGANSQFMVGYIYANHLKDFDKATEELNRFLTDFQSVADSGLIAGAKFELEFMGKDIEDIPVLSDLGTGTPADTVVKQRTD